MTMTTIPHPPPRPRHPRHPRRSPAPPARFALYPVAPSERLVDRPSDRRCRWMMSRDGDDARARAPCLRDQSHVIVVDDGDPRRGAPIRARAHRRHPATTSKKPYRHRRRHPSSSSSSSSSIVVVIPECDIVTIRSTATRSRTHTHTYHSCRRARGGTHRHRHRVRRRHHQSPRARKAPSRAYLSRPRKPRPQG